MIESDTSKYAKSRIFNQLTLDQNFFRYVINENLKFFKSNQWHSTAFFSKKIILAETQYKIQNQELLVIIKTFKIWHYYLKNCKYNILIFTHHNNFCQFIHIKSLRS